MQISKPMLAGRLSDSDIDNLVFPLSCSRKLDGIRTLMVNSHALSRNFKPIPNNYIRHLLEDNIPDGYDGEILLNSNMFNFQAISSAVMSESGEPDFVFCIFDKYSLDGYSKRMQFLAAQDFLDHLPFRVVRLLPQIVYNKQELLALEQQYLSEGYEGIIIRSPNGPYKFGRSTVKEGYLMKLKRFSDSEATILSLEEQLENTNDLKRDELGYADRSTFKSGMIPKGTLGSLHVRDISTGIEFSIGSGLDDAQRQLIWNNPSFYIGKIVKYRYQSTGIKEAPRFPVFIGFRDPRDMSE